MLLHQALLGVVSKLGAKICTKLSKLGYSVEIRNQYFCYLFRCTALLNDVRIPAHSERSRIGLIQAFVPSFRGFSHNSQVQGHSWSLSKSSRAGAAPFSWLRLQPKMGGTAQQHGSKVTRISDLNLGLSIPALYHCCFTELYRAGQGRYIYK